MGKVSLQQFVLPPQSPITDHLEKLGDVIIGTFKLLIDEGFE